MSQSHVSATAPPVYYGRLLAATVRKYRHPSDLARHRFERILRGFMYAAPTAGGRLVVFRRIPSPDLYQACWALHTTDVKRLLYDLAARRLIVETRNSRYLITLDDATPEEFAEFCGSRSG